MSFYREKPIKAVRKSRQCMGCRKQIEIGASALECAGHWEGDFWSGTYHAECRKAECAYNDLVGQTGDEWCALGEMDSEDWGWLIETFPVVAERMAITAERIEQAAERRASFWSNTPASVTLA